MTALDGQPRPDNPDYVWTISAAFEDASAAQAAIVDLVRAGLREADVTVMSPWPMGAPAPDVGDRLLDHPVRLAVATGLAMAALLAAAAAIWAGSGNWVLYGWIGVVVGVLGSTLAGALSASSPPNWHDRLLGDRLGAVTVDVSTTADESADVARAVMANHDPSVVLTLTEPGPRPPEEHVLWDHEEGLSPLEHLSSWRDARVRAEERRAPRGRHLEPDRARG